MYYLQSVFPFPVYHFSEGQTSDNLDGLALWFKRKKAHEELHAACHISKCGFTCFVSFSNSLSFVSFSNSLSFVLERRCQSLRKDLVCCLLVTCLLHLGGTFLVRVRFFEHLSFVRVTSPNTLLWCHPSLDGPNYILYLY